MLRHSESRFLGESVDPDPTELHVILGDVQDGMPEIEDASVDLACYSPPYRKVDGFSLGLIELLGAGLARVLKPGARAFMNFAQLAEGLSRPQDAFGVLVSGGAGALLPGQTFAWITSLGMVGAQRGHFQPISSRSPLFNYCWEFVFTVTRGRPAQTDRLAIGVPYTCKSNLTRGTRGKHGDVHCAGDAWLIPYETTGHKTTKAHQHGYPLGLVRRCILGSGIAEGSTVLDPFLGGGTTAVAARLCGMNAIGYDVSKTALEESERLWALYRGQRWAAWPTPAPLKFIMSRTGPGSRLLLPIES